MYSARLQLSPLYSSYLSPAFHDRISALAHDKEEKAIVFVPSDQTLGNKDIASAILSYLQTPLQMGKMGLVSKGMRDLIVEQDWEAMADDLMFTPSSELPKFRICPWLWPRRVVKLDNHVIRIQNVTIVNQKTVLVTYLTRERAMEKVLVGPGKPVIRADMKRPVWKSRSHNPHDHRATLDRLHMAGFIETRENVRITPIHLGAFALQFHGSDVLIFSTDCERLLATIESDPFATVVYSGASLFVVTADSVAAYCPP